MTTITDVAKLANVSVATVSRVLNCKPNTSQVAIDAVNAAVKELNYNPQKSKTNKRNPDLDSPIGVLVADVSNSFYGLIVKSIDKVARSHGRSLLITNGYHDAEYEREAIELLINHGCESIIVHSKALPDDTLIRFANRIPGLILINRDIELLTGRCISLDNIDGSITSVQHLINKGHKNIGYIGSDHNISDAIDRIEGYRRALESNHIGFSENNIVCAEPDYQGGAEAMSDLLAKNTPITAVATYNDVMASGAMAVLKENGIRVPEDISIIGFDDSSIAEHIQPKLTTMRYPVQVMADEAAKLAIELTSGNPILDKPSKIYISTLVPRASVIQR